MTRPALPHSTLVPVLAPVLAPYAPPTLPRATLAVGLAPMLVLLVFVAVVLRWMDVDTAFASFAACAVWVATEMHAWQRITDAYNADYVRLHLAWRSSDTLAALAMHDRTPTETRSFVLRYLDHGRVLRPDGPVIS